jgi:hypothetical protein
VTPPDDGAGVAAVAHVIQLSISPVFLLSGIGALLAVLTTRLARVIDRARALAGQEPGAPPAARATLAQEQAILGQRARLVSRAIALCTAAALLICAVIAILFSGAFFRYDASVPVALLFIAAMLCLFVGLVYFLREIFVATAALRIGLDS